MRKQLEMLHYVYHLTSVQLNHGKLEISHIRGATLRLIKYD